MLETISEEEDEAEESAVENEVKDNQSEKEKVFSYRYDTKKERFDQILLIDQPTPLHSAYTTHNTNNTKIT